MGGYYTRLRKATTSQELDEDTGILHANYHLSPTENLVGYAYWYDSNKDTFAVTGTSAMNLSNRTVGVRLDGAHPVNKNGKFYIPLNTLNKIIFQMVTPILMRIITN